MCPGLGLWHPSARKQGPTSLLTDTKTPRKASKAIRVPTSAGVGEKLPCHHREWTGQNSGPPQEPALPRCGRKSHSPNPQPSGRPLRPISSKVSPREARQPTRRRVAFGEANRPGYLTLHSDKNSPLSCAFVWWGGQSDQRMQIGCNCVIR